MWLVEEFANLLKFCGGDLSRAERMQHQLPHGTAENPIHQITHHLALRAFCRHHRHNGMGAVAIFPRHEVLLRHDLEKAEHRGVGERFRARGIEHFEDFPDGAPPAVPEYAEDGEFSIRGPWWREFFRSIAWRGDIATERLVGRPIKVSCVIRAPNERALPGEDHQAWD